MSTLHPIPPSPPHTHTQTNQATSCSWARSLWKSHEGRGTIHLLRTFLATNSEIYSLDMVAKSRTPGSAVLPRESLFPLWSQDHNFQGVIQFGVSSHISFLFFLSIERLTLTMVHILLFVHCAFFFSFFFTLLSPWHPSRSRTGVKRGWGKWGRGGREWDVWIFMDWGLIPHDLYFFILFSILLSYSCPDRDRFGSFPSSLLWGWSEEEEVEEEEYVCWLQLLTFFLFISTSFLTFCDRSVPTFIFYFSD